MDRCSQAHTSAQADRVCTVESCRGQHAAAAGTTELYRALVLRRGMLLFGRQSCNAPSRVHSKLRMHLVNFSWPSSTHCKGAHAALTGDVLISGLAQDPEYPVSNLGLKGADTKGWHTPRYVMHTELVQVATGPALPAKMITSGRNTGSPCSSASHLEAMLRSLSES